MSNVDRQSDTRDLGTRRQTARPPRIETSSGSGPGSLPRPPQDGSGPRINDGAGLTSAKLYREVHSFLLQIQPRQRCSSLTEE